MASEIIKILQAAVDEHGDLPIYVEGDKSLAVSINLEDEPRIVFEER